MKNNKFLSCLLVILIFASMFATTTFAETLTSGDYSYTVNEDGTCTITDYSGAGGEVTIPDSLGGYTVSSIGELAFGGSGLIVVTIPGSVTSIGEGAFRGCSGLTNVTIPDSVTSIGGGAFYACSGLKSVTIPGSVESIGAEAFNGCSGLTGVTIQFGVESIGAEAFNGCSGLTDVTIPGSVGSIGEFAFERCSGLTGITFQFGVKSIGMYAFYRCSGLASVTIPGSVERIGEHAFYECSGLTDLTIQFGVGSIGGGAFYACSGLKSVTIPGSVESIGNEAFIGCSGLTSLTIKDGVESIGEMAFYDCRGLTSVTIPGSIVSIGDWAFDGCNGLTDLTIRFGVERIGNGAFFNCSGLTSVTIPASVASIGQHAFNGCSLLTSVTIPASVERMEWQVFTDCSNLRSVYFDGSKPTIDEPMCYNVSPSPVRYYPIGKTGYDASFQAVTDIKTVAVSSTANGTITPSTASGMPGETISLKITPDDGYKLKSGSLTYNDGSSSYSISGTGFTMPEDNITISGEFEKTDPAVSIIPNSSMTKNQKPTWNWTDTTGADYYRYKLNDAAEWTYTDSRNYTPDYELSDGIYTLYVQEWDSRKYWTDSGSASITVKNTNSKHPAAAAVEKSERATVTVPLAQINAAIIRAADAAAGSNNNTFTISTPIASMSFDCNALNTISKEASEDVKFVISKVDPAALSEETKQIVGDRPVFDFSVTSGDKVISQFGGNVSVSMPYTPKAGEDTNAIVIYSINSDGKPEAVTDCSYDPETGRITFVTNHFSMYAVGYNKVVFHDVASTAWYADAVSFVAARDITTGTGNGNYSPKAKLTRGQFLVMVMRAYGIPADTNANDNFSDAGNTYYTGYLSAAKKLGITAGTGNNRYGPDKVITRQELFTLLYNTQKQINDLPTAATGKTLTFYSDTNDIAPWARDAMTQFAEAGIISGSGSKLSPTGTATRAEMAQVLYNLLAK